MINPRLLLPALFLTACGEPPKPSAGPGGMPAAQVTLAEVESRRLVEWEEFTGRIEATETVELRPRVSGYITEVHFEAGALVEEGDILFTIDQRSFETRQRAASAEVARAEAAALMAKREFDRVNDLLAARAIAPEQAEGRESAYRQSEALLEAARASQQSADIEMEHTGVKAPISGRISRAAVTAGNFVTAGVTVLTTIVTVDPVFVYTDIDEQSLLRLQSLKHQGSLHVDETGRVPVEVQLANEEAFPHRGFIESFDNRLDAATGSMVLRCALPNADGRLIPGLFARVRLPVTSEYDALLVEAKAVLTDQANKYVLSVTSGSVTVYKPVVIGPAVGDKRIIRSGLEAGEKVIVNGMARLPQPGMPVQPVDSPPAEGAGAADTGKP
jgi:RND family efflux transporter MFP subunit